MLVSDQLCVIYGSSCQLRVIHRSWLLRLPVSDYVTEPSVFCMLRRGVRDIACSLLVLQALDNSMCLEEEQYPLTGPSSKALGSCIFGDQQQIRKPSMTVGDLLFCAIPGVLNLIIFSLGYWLPYTRKC